MNDRVANAGFRALDSFDAETRDVQFQPSWMPPQGYCDPRSNAIFQRGCDVCNHPVVRQLVFEITPGDMGNVGVEYFDVRSD
jgi:hypothetical protein